MKISTPVVVEEKGRGMGMFMSVSDAAKSVGLTDKAIRHRIHAGMKTVDWTYRYATPDETAFIRQLASGVPKTDRSALIKELSQTKRRYKRKPLKELECEGDRDWVLLGKKYDIVPYEITAGRVCVTQCPYREAPKPKVGSALCMACTSFHGRNRVRRQVACSAVKGKTWKRFDIQ